MSDLPRLVDAPAASAGPALASPARHWRRRALWSLALLTLALLLVRSALSPPADPTTAYLVQTIDRGPMTRIVTASGTLNPVSQVQVGTQVSGTIRRIAVDFNSRVRTGDLLAQLDATALEADVQSMRAALQSAQASAELARLRQLRNESLVDQGFIARSEVDDTRTALATALATVEQQQAALRRSETSLRFAEIRSPVSGTVVSREIAVGQTVAASFSTPVLFRIAQDLRDMQIEANVSEADVALLRAGQEVSFSVDAFPEQAFRGTVFQIRNSYSVQQNVVTYPVVIQARNDDERLRPGMTAYVRVAVGHREAALRVPNAALRWHGPASPEPGSAPRPPAPPAVAGERTVWRLHADGSVEPVNLRPGLSDTRWTEQAQGPLAEGDRLVIGEKPAARAFGPRIF